MESLIRYGGPYLVQDLLLGRMSVADAAEFNDPFEFHFVPGKPLSTAQAKQRVRKAMQSPRVRHHQKIVFEQLGITWSKQRKILKENSKSIIEGFKQGDRESIEGLRSQIFTFTKEAAKIVCCTRNDVDDEAENCMWAYYAANHTGVRLHLNRSFYSKYVRCFEIEYAAEPPVFESAEMNDPEKLVDFVMRSIGRKASAWRHEKEVRVLVPIGEVFEAPDIHGRSRCFTKLDASSVERIDIGIRHESPNSTLKEISDRLPGVSVFRATKASDSYRVKYEKIS